MLRWLAPALLVLGLAGCDDGPACVIDTDCSGVAICVQQSCVEPGGSRDAGSRRDARSSDGGDEDAGEGDLGVEPGSLGSGAVTLDSLPAADPLVDTGRYVVSASFARSGGPTCMEFPVGGCAVTVCEPPAAPVDGGTGDPDAGTPAPDPAPHAGAVQVSGGALALTLQPTDLGTYDVETGPMPLFAAGDDLVVTAPGDEVPAFRTTGLQGVETLTASAPELPAAGPLSVDTGADLELAWATTAETPDDAVVWARLTGATVEGAPVSILCSFEASAGAGTIDKSLFPLLADGLRRGPRLNVSVRDVERIERAGWSIDVSAGAPLVSNGRSFDVAMTYVASSK